MVPQADPIFDASIAVLTQFASKNNLSPTKGTLSTMIAAINPKTCTIPEFGLMLSHQGSNVFHTWILSVSRASHFFWLPFASEFFSLA